MSARNPDARAGTIDAAGPPAPLVSVVLPSRDRPLEVRRAAATVIAQTFRDWELLIVDDGSDPAADVVGLRALDDRIAVLRNEEPRGVSRARNRGIAEARGRWIAFLDDDDLWHPTKLEAQLAAAEREDATFVYTAATVVEPGRRVYVQEVVPDADYARRLTRANVVRAPSSALVRADALAQTTGFDPALSVMADWDLWMRLVPHVRVAAVSEPLAGVLEHPGSMQLALADQIQAEIDRFAARHDAEIAAAGTPFPTVDVQRWHAQKLWAARRSPLRGVRYAAAVVRANGVGGTLRKATEHRAWGHAAAPVWISEQLEAPVLLPVGTGRPASVGAAARAV